MLVRQSKVDFEQAIEFIMGDTTLSRYEQFEEIEYLSPPIGVIERTLSGDDWQEYQWWIYANIK